MEGNMAFMFESSYFLRTTSFAMDDSIIEHDKNYYKVWSELKLEINLMNSVGKVWKTILILPRNNVNTNFIEICNYLKLSNSYYYKQIMIIKLYNEYWNYLI